MQTEYNFTFALACPAEFGMAINASGNYSQVCDYVLVEEGTQVTVAFANPIPEPEEILLETFLTSFVCPIPQTEQEEDEAPPGEDDPTTGETVSFAEMCFMWSESRITNRDWVQIGAASDSDSGYIMPHKGVITRATAHVEEVDGSVKKALDLYINNTKIDDLLTFGGSSTQQSPLDSQGDSDDDDDDEWKNQHRIRNDLNIQFEAGDKLRLRGDMNSGKLEDTCIAIWYKWRL